MPEPSPPDKVLNPADRGDDVQRRFRYQSACAARIALDLVSEDGTASEIFCELHDDILVKRRNGKFSAIQVKTREPGQGPFKARDPEVIGSLKRFIDLENRFKNHFESYILATNAGFWHDNATIQNLSFLLDRLKRNPATLTGPDKGIIDAYISELEGKAGIPGSTARAALLKIQLDGQLPGLESVEPDLLSRIGGLPGMKHRRYDDLQCAAVSLIEKCHKASSLSPDSPTAKYIALSGDQKQAKADATILDKRITKEIVDQILQKSLTPEALLRSWKVVPIEALPKGMRRMELKMASGGLSKANIDLSMDHKLSAETLLSEWLYKYGPEKASELHQHLRTIVLTECQEAHDTVQSKGGLFGNAMLEDVRRRLRERHAHDIVNQIPCQYEHILGISGILTSECKVWWSTPFKIPEDIV